MKLRNGLAMLLLGIGFTQMVGDLVGSKILRGVGLASGIAPFPKVFCEADGYEAFAAKFRLIGISADGSSWSCDLGPDLYSKLPGPYNRRNVHGAALAFAPRLPAELRDALLQHNLAPNSALRRELGIPADVTQLRVEILPRAGESDGPWIFPQS